MRTKESLLYVEARKYCDEGKLIARESWGNKRFLFVFPGSTVGLHFGNPELPKQVRDYFERNFAPVDKKNNLCVTLSSCLCLKAEDHRIIPGWAPSLSDQEATDWVVLE